MYVTQSVAAPQVRSVPQTCAFASFAHTSRPSLCGGSSLFTSGAEYKGDFKFGRHQLKYAPNPAEPHGAAALGVRSCHPAGVTNVPAPCGADETYLGINYPPPGYSFLIDSHNTNQTAAASAVADMQASGFIDTQTVAVFVDASVYNPVLDLVAVVRFYFEQTPSGGIHAGYYCGIVSLTPDSLVHATRVAAVVMCVWFMAAELRMLVGGLVDFGRGGGIRERVAEIVDSKSTEVVDVTRRRNMLAALERLFKLQTSSAYGKAACCSCVRVLWRVRA